MLILILSDSSIHHFSSTQNYLNRSLQIHHWKKRQNLSSKNQNIKKLLDRIDMHSQNSLHFSESEFDNDWNTRFISMKRRNGCIINPSSELIQNLREQFLQSPKLKQLVRRKSCSCTCCGGLSKLEKKTIHLRPPVSERKQAQLFPDRKTCFSDQLLFQIPPIQHSSSKKFQEGKTKSKLNFVVNLFFRTRI